VVHDRGEEYPGDDRPRPLETRGEQQRQQLCLVADFGQGDDSGGYEKRFQGAFQKEEGRRVAP
jgi:hypothetical protein